MGKRPDTHVRAVTFLARQPGTCPALHPHVFKGLDQVELQHKKTCIYQWGSPTLVGQSQLY